MKTINLTVVELKAILGNYFKLDEMPSELEIMVTLSDEAASDAGFSRATIDSLELFDK